MFRHTLNGLSGTDCYSRQSKVAMMLYSLPCYEHEQSIQGLPKATDRAQGETNVNVPYVHYLLHIQSADDRGKNDLQASIQRGRNQGGDYMYSEDPIRCKMIKI